MREILFKAKRIDNGEWVKGLITIMWGQYHIISPDDENTAYPIDTDTICQYTGLTDKNGNKIWENDILVIDEDSTRESTGKGFILFYKGAFISSYGEIMGNFIFDDLHTINKEREVIGNKFDNPELLKGES